MLLFTVSISGGAVMILELLGTRIIAPFYGVSLYVWSALISVTMIALAAGYYCGGWLADRYTGLKLYHILMLAALSNALIPLLDQPVMQLTDPLGLRAGAFASALLLFSAPLTALAMVGPFTIKLATENLRHLGSTVGLVYAISTLGSVLATLLLGFYLLPLLGTQLIIYAMSLILLLLAAWLAVLDRRAAFGRVSGILLLGMAGGVVALLALGYAQPARSANGYQVLHAEESLYGWVRVVDNRQYGIRLLLSDSSVLSATALADGSTLLGYQQVMGLLPLFRPAARAALLIGLGGGHVARDLKRQGLETDTIEIDPAVADAALKYFDFQPTGEFLVGDGRFEIQKLHKRYDLIIEDCFTGGSEPIHMLSVEMLRELRDKLGDDGVLVVNYVGFTQGEGTRAVASVYKTLQAVLPEVNVYITDQAEFTDFIFLASKTPLQLDTASKDPRVRWLLGRQVALNAADGVLVSDDYNPLESLQLRKAEYYRKVFMARIAPELLFR